MIIRNVTKRSFGMTLLTNMNYCASFGENSGLDEVEHLLPEFQSHGAECPESIFVLFYVQIRSSQTLAEQSKIEERDHIRSLISPTTSETVQVLHIFVHKVKIFVQFMDKKCLARINMSK